MKKIAIIAVIVAALTFGALNYHFILMDSSIKATEENGFNLCIVPLLTAEAQKNTSFILTALWLKAGSKRSVRG